MTSACPTPVRVGWMLMFVACQGAPRHAAIALPTPTPYPTRVVELHFGSADGPVVGRAYPGAVLDVAPLDPRHVLVTVPRVNAPLFADADAFAATPEPPVTPPREGRLLKDMPILGLFPTPDQTKFFATTLCGEIRVSASDAAHVTQVHEGVLLTGWAEWTLDMTRGPIRCGLRIVQREPDGSWMLSRGTNERDVEEVRSTPDGFVHVDYGAADDLAPRFANGGSVYWLVASTTRAACKKWTFGRVHEEGRSVLALEPPIRVDGRPGFASFIALYDADKRELDLLGPHFSSRPIDRPSIQADLGGYRCGTSYTFVGSKDGALRMFPGAPGPKTVAWNPDDEELWYPSEDACARAAKTAADALARDPEALPPGGVHVDCYPELQP